jgi:formyl-CoA transferase
MTSALEGVRVVEFASYVAGPYAGMLLGDLGADIVKIEPPPHGDPFRGWETGNYASTFYSMNRNKKSIVLDLRSPRGLEVARALVDRADVLLENSRVGAMDRLGLGYEALRETNPRLIYCSITGYGPSGPYAHRPGYDTVGQAMSGLLGLLTDLDEPQLMGISLSDHLGGVFGAYGILAALAARERTGVGQRVDTSLLQGSLALMGESMSRYLATGNVPTRATRAQNAGVFAFTDQDGAPFVIHLSSPVKFWRALMATIGRPELADDPRFATRGARQRNRAELNGILREAFRTGSREEWLARLEAQDVPCGPLYTLDEVAADPQVQHLGMVREFTHPTEGTKQIVGNGVLFGSTPTVLAPAPVLDEHREVILTELGLPSSYLDA